MSATLLPLVQDKAVEYELLGQADSKLQVLRLDRGAAPQPLLVHCYASDVLRPRHSPAEYQTSVRCDSDSRKICKILIFLKF